MLTDMHFLPTSREELTEQGRNRVDFVLITGDAYVDHPSFGAALIGRWLEHHGYSVAILAQPDWKSSLPFKEFGKPILGFLVTGGNLDSMLNNYTASKKPRRDDAYSPGGTGGKRPDHAALVYANRAREAYKGIPVILGGIEASLRRMAHYDYWDNRLRRSLILDSKADLIVFGMAERTILEIASRLRNGEHVSSLTDIAGTVYVTSSKTLPERYVELPAYDDILADKKLFAESFRLSEREQNSYTGKILVQKHGERYVVQNRPAMPLSTDEMDQVYALPFRRSWHPSYDDQGGVPAIREISFSITSHRGCYGGCSFCALTYHQGKVISARSKESIVEEAKLLIKEPGFKGYIHDIGGPTANFRLSACDKMKRRGACPDRDCLGENPCSKIEPDHHEYLSILREVRNLPGIKKVFIRSGIRYDYMLLDKSDEFFRELVEHHVSGQLKVAPEHASDKVLGLMRKPSFDVYRKFRKKFLDYNAKIGKKQFLVPYLMSGHPGSTLSDAIRMAEEIRDMGGTMPEQVQEFIPTPGSRSTAMYFSGINPDTGKPIPIALSREEKDMQRALIQYQKPENRRIVEKALRQAGRGDLIGYGEKCLIRPMKASDTIDNQQRKNSNWKGSGKNKENSGSRGKIGSEKPSRKNKTKISKIDKKSKFSAENRDRKSDKNLSTNNPGKKSRKTKR